MRWIIGLTLLVCLLPAGCGVLMSADNKAQLGQNIAIVKYTVEQDAQGNVAPATYSQVMRRVYVLLRGWQDDMTLNGVPTNETDKQAYIDSVYAELPAFPYPATQPAE